MQLTPRPTHTLTPHTLTLTHPHLNTPGLRKYPILLASSSHFWSWQVDSENHQSRGRVEIFVYADTVQQLPCIIQSIHLNFSHILAQNRCNIWRNPCCEQPSSFVRIECNQAMQQQTDRTIVVRLFLARWPQQKPRRERGYILCVLSTPIKSRMDKATFLSKFSQPHPAKKKEG